MSTKTRIFSLGLLSIFLVSLVAFSSNVAADPGMTPPDMTVDVQSNRHQGQVAANQSQQLRFRNQFQFQVRTNVSMMLDVECDDSVGEYNFQLELNTSEGAELKIQLHSEDGELGLQQNMQIKTKNQNRYRYQEQFMANISINGSVHAKLGIDTADKAATWAYYDEANEEWVPVESTYEDGVLYCETDHFSIWTVITPEEDTTESTIDGYSAFAAIAGLGLIGILVVIAKKRN